MTISRFLYSLALPSIYVACIHVVKQVQGDKIYQVI
jgi:hypothetical protein